MQLTAVHPKLPMRNPNFTRTFYIDLLGFEEIGDSSFEAYLMLRKDQIEIHFFLFELLNPLENYGQIYIRTEDIQALYTRYKQDGIQIHPNGGLELKPWRQWEFSILDPDHNLITFGQAM